MKNLHTPVMLKEVMSFIPSNKLINVIDATFGGGGYTKEILKKENVVELLAIDRDPISVQLSKDLKIKNINFNYSEFENLDASSLAKIICIISPLDHLIKQMLLEFDSDYELCKNLLSVLEIEMKNNENNLKIN